MLADATYASEEFSMAVLESPAYKGTYCFKFFYNFYVSLSGMYKKVILL